MNFDNLPIVAYGYENTRPTERAALMMVKLENASDQYPGLAVPLVRLSDVRREALATQRQGEGENRKIAQLIIDNDRAGAVKWATGLIGNFDGPSCRIDPDATSQGVAVAQPDAPPCETCNGNGMIGGPCYREPDEGGVPCPDCGPAGAAQGEVN